MKRREFVGGLIGAVAWPVAARAQQKTVPVIGLLRSTSLFPFQNLITAFRQGLVGQPVDIIVGNTPSALAAKTATKTIPIVFITGSDAVRDGLVPNLNRPGGNVTGIVFITSVLIPKRLELLLQIVPNATIIAMLVNPNSPETEAERRDAQAAAQAVGQQLITVEVSSQHEIETAFKTISQGGTDALLVGTGPFLFSNRARVIALADRHALPASYPLREYAMAGGLMSYGASQSDSYREAGIYAGRILKGEKPDDMPVRQSTKFELAINLKTAKTLGLTIPPSLLARA